MAEIKAFYTRRQNTPRWLLIAYDGDGKRLNYVDQGLAFHLTQTVYDQEIDLPQGLVYLHVVVHDLTNSRVGATEVPVLVAKE